MAISLIKTINFKLRLYNVWAINLTQTWTMSK